MIFQRQWTLILFIIPLIWLVAARWRHRSGPSILEIGICAILIIALSGPQIAPERRPGVAILVDSAPDASASERSRTEALLHEVEKTAGKGAFSVIKFSDDQSNGQGRVNPNLKDATLQEIETLNGPDRNGAGRERLVIISNGRHQFGSVAEATQLARDAHVPVDSVVLPQKPEIVVTSTSAPSANLAGEPVAINVKVWSPTATDAEAAISVNRQVIESKKVRLEKGDNLMQITPLIETVGVTEVSGVISTPDSGFATFSRSLVSRPARILIVSNQPSPFEEIAQQALGGRIAVVRSMSIPDSLNTYHVVALDTQGFGELSASQKTNIETFLRRGGGMVILGKADVGSGEVSGDPFEQVLPPSAPASAGPACIVVVVEKSASMDGLKRELARLASLGLVENLRQTDMLGILQFSENFNWLVPIHDYREKDGIDRQIDEMDVGGSTRIAPALAEAIRQITPIRATSKHIILLTDGISEDPASFALARRAALRRVTVSTAALGDEANRQYLDKLAKSGRGAFLLIRDPFDIDSALFSDLLFFTSPTRDGTHFNTTMGQVKGILRAVGNNEAAQPPVIRRHYGEGEAVFVSNGHEAATNREVARQEKFWHDVITAILPRQRDAGREVAAGSGSRNDDAIGKEQLRKLSEMTGGRFNSDPNQAFESQKPTGPALKLWPLLVFLALALGVVEEFMRTRGSLQKIARHLKRSAV
jgi:hypothetical protein